jgi:hypothetical protein
LPNIAPDEELTITYSLATPSDKNSIRTYYDDMENGPEDRWDVYFDPDGNVDNFWFPSDVLVHSGISAWGVSDPPLASQHYLQNYESFTVAGAYPYIVFIITTIRRPVLMVDFWKSLRTTDSPWETLDPYMFRNRYPRKIQYATFVIPNLYAFSWFEFA